MHTLTRDFLYDVGGVPDLGRPRRKSLIQTMLGRLAIGQILGEQFLYEVHGPYTSIDPEPTRRSFFKELIERVSAWVRGIASRSRPRRAANEMSCLDERMLKDIGVTRAEIDAIFSAPIEDRRD